MEELGCTVTEAASAEAALSVANHEALELAFVDLRLGDGSGLELIPKLLSSNRELDIVLITAYATFDNAVHAIIYPSPLPRRRFATWWSEFSRSGRCCIN